jgi:UDP-N-acetylmuramate--alanine ligase
VEWAAAQRRGLAITSEAEFWTELTTSRLRLTVTGTHGKTTTASLLAWMLECAGMSPGFRLGVTSRDLGATARLGEGRPFVFEGDEYTTAPWDPRPKFLHTHPQAACVTRLELDHPDVFRSFDAYRAPFVELAASMPGDGLLALCADDGECLALRPHASCATVTYGSAQDAEWRVVHDSMPPAAAAAAPPLQRFTVRRGVDGGHPDSTGADIDVALTLPGAHNALNATAALILAQHAGASLDACVDACATFKGASRRFEILGSAGGITVVDDYAHHPTEVAATIDAARQRFPDSRLLVVYVPHTYSRTLTLLDDYAPVFAGVQLLLLGHIEPARERHLAHTVSSADVAARVRGVDDVRVVGSSDEALAILLDTARSGDAILCLSVRGFDDLAKRALRALRERHGD